MASHDVRTDVEYENGIHYVPFCLDCSWTGERHDTEDGARREADEHAEVTARP